MDLRRIGQGAQAEIFAWSDDRVLRLYRNPDAHGAVEAERTALEMGAAIGAPVPRVYEQVIIEGRPGLVMERIDGRDLLTLVGRRPWTIGRVGRSLGDLHADLHEVVLPPEVPALRDRVRIHIEGSGQIEGSGLPEPERAFALELLAALPDGDRVCHGDFHPGNVLLSSRGPLVIDWPNAVRGEPTGDVARTLVLLEISVLPPGTPRHVRRLARVARGLLRRSYLRRYARRRPVDRHLLDRWVLVRTAERAAEGFEAERPVILERLRAAREAHSPQEGSW